MKPADLISVGEAASILGCSTKWVDRLLITKALKTVTTITAQKHRLLDRKDVLRFKKERGRDKK